MPAIHDALSNTPYGRCGLAQATAALCAYSKVACCAQNPWPRANGMTNNPKQSSIKRQMQSLLSIRSQIR